MGSISWLHIAVLGALLGGFFIYSLRAPPDRVALVRILMGAALLVGVFLMGVRDRMNETIFNGIVLFGIALVAVGVWDFYKFWRRREEKP